MRGLSHVSEDLLGRIELSELRSLKWGYVDGSLSEAEVLQLAADVVGDNASGMQPEDVVEELLDSFLIIEFSIQSEIRYRSRFAEGVRLIRNLRQLMYPTTRNPRHWAAAPSLVSDYRIDVRPRRYPKRNIPPLKVKEELTQLGVMTEFRSKLIDSMLGVDEDALKLSAFQFDAAKSILGVDGTDSGTVISSGTGSGKTLAFYFPALLLVADLIQKDDYWVKTVALYPRVELLKDQFTEAFRLIRRTDEDMKSSGRRPIILGSFFASTPNEATIQDVKNSRWVQDGSGFICPYLRCPICLKNMIWSEDDLNEQIERLTCQDPNCTGIATEDQISLVREGQPPDILFTTTESLNQNISNLNHRHNFGIYHSTSKRLRLALLDEIHTYSGTSGAQVAFLMRRWRWALKRPIKITGLSATLEGPIEFFSQLTGLKQHSIEHINPQQQDLQNGSMEYQIMLRGDPASRTALLSTSIQTSFLMGRVLDQMQSANVSTDTTKTNPDLLKIINS